MAASIRISADENHRYINSFSPVSSGSLLELICEMICQFIYLLFLNVREPKCPFIYHFVPPSVHPSIRPQRLAASSPSIYTRQPSSQGLAGEEGRLVRKSLQMRMSETGT